MFPLGTKTNQFKIQTKCHLLHQYPHHYPLHGEQLQNPLHWDGKDNNHTPQLVDQILWKDHLHFYPTQLEEMQTVEVAHYNTGDNQECQVL